MPVIKKYFVSGIRIFTAKCKVWAHNIHCTIKWIFKRKAKQRAYPKVISP